MTDRKVPVIPGTKQREWIAAFEVDPPLHTFFPVTLINGKQVPGVHLVCSQCGNHLSGDHVHGRVMRSLPHVITVSGNGMCRPCDRLTHIDCRLRANGAETLVEWMHTSGHWQARQLRQPTLIEKIAGRLRRWVARFALVQ